MAQPGHATDIYTYRYIGQDLRTTFAEDTNRGRDISYQVVSVPFADASATTSTKAPCDGKLVKATVQSQTTTDGTHKITVGITNETESNTMVTGVLWDDDPVCTSDTEKDLVLTTTAADLLVSRGDAVEVAYTEAGTIAGLVVTMWYENF